MPDAFLNAQQRRMLSWGLVAIALLAALAIAAAAGRRAIAGVAGFGRAQPPAITQELVVQRIQAVARLVASEMTLRDVVTYQQTRLGSTKRTLLVVTARVAAGIDLEKGAQVRIDSVEKRIRVTLPPAEVFSVDIVNVRTYDERAGLINPFTGADRDVIQQRVRAQLLAAAQQSGILQHADESAARALEQLLAQDGYSVEVIRRVTLLVPSG
ncbi:MAG: DUF4230 domain-containing protein [Gemmatimonadaceae bacterium]|nr:DUF4230 domain-containing protein [Gemmatimonadaceae bacterium]